MVNIYSYLLCSLKIFKKCSKFHWFILIRGLNFTASVYELFDNPSYHSKNQNCTIFTSRGFCVPWLQWSPLNSFHCHTLYGLGHHFLHLFNTNISWRCLLGQGLGGLEHLGWGPSLSLWRGGRWALRPWGRHAWMLLGWGSSGGRLFLLHSHSLLSFLQGFTMVCLHLS